MNRVFILPRITTLLSKSTQGFFIVLFFVLVNLLWKHVIVYIISNNPTRNQIYYLLKFVGQPLLLRELIFLKGYSQLFVVLHGIGIQFV